MGEHRRAAAAVTVALLALASLSVSCDGAIGDPPFAGSTGRPGVPDGTFHVDPGDPRQALGPSGLRRLTQAELRATIEDLLGSDPGADVELVPADATTPFDNDYTTQIASAALIEGVKAVADRAADRLLADAAMRDRIVGCTPAGPSDATCLRSFVTRFGRRALRRPLSEEEISEYLSFQSLAVSESDFYVAVAAIVRTMLQELDFLYRVEIGTPVPQVPGMAQLSSWEVASRLSYFLWGSTPDDALLDLAQSDALRTGDQIRAAATRMLDAPRANERIARFHAQWLGFDKPSLPPALIAPMRAETDALIARVVLEERTSWLDIFRSTETFVNDDLAAHYGLPLPGSSEPRWVSYGDSGRQGILSHGTFLSVGSKFGDTSPTQRGIAVRTRLLCQTIPPPPPGVNTDTPPEDTTTMSACKWDRYAAHRAGGCASCHSQIDPIGFGLERFDQVGRYRTHDVDAPECEISGEGELAGVGTFNGPAELSELLISSGMLEHCAMTQLYRFAIGRNETTEDAHAIDDLTARFESSGRRLDQLLLDFVSSPGFAYRIVEGG